MPKYSLLLLILTAIYSNAAFSQLYEGKNLSETTLNQLIDQVKPGTILLLGENHGLASHRDQHIEVLNALRAKGLKVSVGMEFVNYTDQLTLNNYRSGALSELDFLTSIKWGGFNFDFYRPQILFPELTKGETTIGLNIPRFVTSKISRQGVDSLTPEEKNLLPPNFELGRDTYRERFMVAAGSHCRVPQNCYIAQCAWDDTMAWKSVEFVNANPEQVLVVVVGEFHVQFGGGIKHRLLQRNPQAKVVTLSQIWAEEMSDEDVLAALQPSPVEGERADFIWVSRP
jgi:uncharacterized iron-regulated protein